MKKIVKLNESEFRNFIAEVAKRMLNENEAIGNEIPNTDEPFDLGLDNLNDKPDIWGDYDKAQDFASDTNLNGGAPLDAGDEFEEPVDGGLNISDEELSGIVSEAIKRVLTKK